MYEKIIILAIFIYILPLLGQNIPSLTSTVKVSESKKRLNDKDVKNWEAKIFKKLTEQFEAKKKEAQSDDDIVIFKEQKKNIEKKTEKKVKENHKKVEIVDLKKNIKQSESNNLTNNIDIEGEEKSLEKKKEKIEKSREKIKKGQIINRKVVF